MKCYICFHEIPEDKKCCPYCGRVITKADRERMAKQNQEKTDGDSTVYRPAGTTKGANSQKTIHIPDLFNPDPNAPEYTDPNSYDRATADVIAYDKKFIKGTDSSPTKQMKPINSDQSYTNPSNNSGGPAGNEEFIDNEYTENGYQDNDYSDNYPDGDYYGNEEYEESENTNAYKESKKSREKRQSKPHLRINVKVLIICIAFLLGMVIIVVGGYQLGRQFGIFGENESGIGTSADGEDSGKKNDEPKSENAAQTTAYKTGKYTVVIDESNEVRNIFVYKSESDPRIIATIPDKEVIEIVEIAGTLGKTTYNNFTGWVKLSDLKYTPGTEDGTGTDTDTGADTGDNSDGNGTTQGIGTYTVDLNGDGTTVNVRSEPSSYSTLLVTIPEGTELTVDKISGNWGHITYQGIEGWVFMDYMKQ